MAPLVGLALGTLLVIVGVVRDSGWPILVGAFLVLVALGASRTKRFHTKSPGGWEFGAETITPGDVADAAQKLAGIRGLDLPRDQAERAAEELLPSPVTLAPEPSRPADRGAGTSWKRSSREAVVTALAEQIVADAGHYAYCPRCGFNTPLMKGEVFGPEVRCPACGTPMERTDQDPKSDLY